MTLLSIGQEVAGRLGLENISSVASSSNGTARRIFRLANASGRSLARRADWQALKKETTFVTVADEEQTNGDLPTDYDHMVPETAFNRTRTRPLSGPLTANEWQEIKARTANIGPTDSFYIRGGVWYMTPDPGAGETIAYEYISKYWVAVAAAPTVGTKNAFTLDTDEVLLDEEMLITDIMWRYKQSRGLPYAEDFRSAELMILGRIARDGAGKRRMQLAKRAMRPAMPQPPVIPEGSWPIT